MTKQEFKSKIVDFQYECAENGIELLIHFPSTWDDIPRVFAVFYGFTSEAGETFTELVLINNMCLFGSVPDVNDYSEQAVSDFISMLSAYLQKMILKYS